MNINALHTITYGLYVISSYKGNKINGQIANTAIQICADPQIISVAINRNNLTHEYISNSRVFTVSILMRDTPLNFIGGFGFKSGRDVDKFAGVNYKTGVSKAPIVTDNSLAYLEVEVIKEVDIYTHTVFAGKLINADVLKEGEPLTYAYYQQVKRGTTPKTAPGYISAKQEDKPKMDRYQCSVCGYVYDPEKGDPDGGIKPGTRFEDIPDDWTCPVCGASKGQFKKI